MLSRIIILPFVVAAGVILYLMIFNYRPDYPTVFIVLVFIITGILMGERRINEWWTDKRKRTSDPSLVNFLFNYVPYYRGLTPPSRKEFEHQLERYITRTDFFAKLSEELPDDIKVLACIYPTVLSYQTGIDLSKKYRTVVFYVHPFLTPEYSEEVHISEVNAEDGVFIFSIEHLQMGYRGSGFFNVAIYETAKAWLGEHIQGKNITERCPEREEVMSLAPYGDDELKRYCGMLPDNCSALLIHHFFVFPEELERKNPDVYNFLIGILGDHHVLSKKSFLY
jgi:Mlc titration factor MtfA (ptsG expression regulator)